MIVVEASSVAVDDFAIVLEIKSSCERKIRLDSMFCFAAKFAIKRLAFLSLTRSPFSEKNSLRNRYIRV